MSDGIHPFRIEIPQADLDYLHGRLGERPLAGRAARRGVGTRHPRSTA